MQPQHMRAGELTPKRRAREEIGIIATAHQEPPPSAREEGLDCRFGDEPTASSAMFGLTFEPRSCCLPSKAAASSASRLRRVIIAAFRCNHTSRWRWHRHHIAGLGANWWLCTRRTHDANAGASLATATSLRSHTFRASRRMLLQRRCKGEDGIETCCCSTDAATIGAGPRLDATGALWQAGRAEDRAGLRCCRARWSPPP